MAQKLYEESNIQAIANAIRGKNGLTTTYKVSEMAAAITAIEGGGSTPIEPPVGDGKTRIYIHLEDGRTSPMLGICPKGTVTVDWGDGTESNTLTGTSVTTVKWTPTHNYAAVGDYVISLTVDGVAGLYGIDGTNEYSCLLRYSSGADIRNRVYQNAIRKIEIGNGITSISSYAFKNCYALESIIIPNTVSSISDFAFAFCHSLSNVSLSNGITSIGYNVFQGCQSLLNISLPNSITSIADSLFYNCVPLSTVSLPNNITSISNYMFSGCYSLPKIEIPDTVTSIGDNAFYYCYSLSNITIPHGVTNIGAYAFGYCQGMKYYDFTALSAVPTLSKANAFTGIAADCEIRVPAALADEWKAATNWATYANKIVGV